MSAALMDGVAGRFSGVVNVEEVEHPIDIAASLGDQEHRVLAGPPATDFARNVLEMSAFDPRTPHRLDEHRSRETGRTGTVGAVALDADGSIWAGTSTGGVGYEIPGRMSDSATVAGTYANALAGVSCTGQGEHIVDHAAAARVLTRVCDGMSLAAAVDKTIAEADRQSLDYGLIGLDREGHALAAQTSDMTTLFCIRDDAGRRGFFDS
jgi:L-asparaginase